MKTFIKYDKLILKKNIRISLIVPLCLVLVACFYKKKDTKSTDNSSKPNIVFIVVDDLGWSDTGFMGNPIYETPNIDKLSMESVLFTDAYAPAANCAPSRACIMSGQNTPRHNNYTVG